MTAGLEVTDPEAYRQQLRELLAGQEPLTVLASTADALREKFAGQSTESVRARPFEEKWTPLEILGHLVDAEWSFAWRLRTVLGDDRPRIEPMDQEQWVIAQQHNERDLQELLDDFAVLRRINLRLWEKLTPEELNRKGLHQQRGEESLDTMRLMLAGHDLSHLDQIERYLAAVAGS